MKIKVKIFLLLLVFVVPIFIGKMLYYYHDRFNFKTNNHGVLVNPPVSVEGFWQTQNKKWEIVYIPQNCNEDQQKIFFTLHQLVIALGKNSNRVEPVLLSAENCKEKFKFDFQFVILTSDLSKKLQAQFDSSFSITGKIYLIDPLRNLFMYYPEAVNPVDIMKDVKKVLEVSQIG